MIIKEEPPIERVCRLHVITRSTNVAGNLTEAFSDLEGSGWMVTEKCAKIVRYGYGLNTSGQ